MPGPVYRSKDWRKKYPGEVEAAVTTSPGFAERAEGVYDPGSSTSDLVASVMNDPGSAAPAAPPAPPPDPTTALEDAMSVLSGGLSTDKPKSPLDRAMAILDAGELGGKKKKSRGDYGRDGTPSADPALAMNDVTGMSPEDFARGDKAIPMNLKDDLTFAATVTPLPGLQAGKGIGTIAGLLGKSIFRKAGANEIENLAGSALKKERTKIDVEPSSFDVYGPFKGTPQGRPIPQRVKNKAPKGTYDSWPKEQKDAYLQAIKRSNQWDKRKDKATQIIDELATRGGAPWKPTSPTKVLSEGAGQLASADAAIAYDKFSPPAKDAPKVEQGGTIDDPMPKANKGGENKSGFSFPDMPDTSGLMDAAERFIGKKSDSSNPLESIPGIGDELGKGLDKAKGQAHPDPMVATYLEGQKQREQGSGLLGAAGQAVDQTLDARSTGGAIAAYDKGKLGRSAGILDNRDLEIPKPISKSLGKHYKEAQSHLADVSGGGVPSGVPDKYKSAVKKWGTYLEKEMKKNGLVGGPGELQPGMTGPEYLAKVLQAESGWDDRIGVPENTSSADAQGLGQFIPSTRQAFMDQFGVDAYSDADSQIKAAAYHLDGNHTAGGLESYNPGYGNWDYYLGQDVGETLPSSGKKVSKAKKLLAAAENKIGMFIDETPKGKLEDKPEGILASLKNGGDDVAQGPVKLDKPTLWMQPNPDDMEKGFKPQLTGEIANTMPQIRALALTISKRAGVPINVISGDRPGSITTSGNVSDHDHGGALDLGILARQEGGTTDTEATGDRMAYEAVLAAGGDKDTAEAIAANGGLYNVESPNGYRTQIIWKTNEGGNHYNHVHIGIPSGEGERVFDETGATRQGELQASSYDAGGGAPSGSPSGAPSTTPSGDNTGQDGRSPDGTPSPADPMSIIDIFGGGKGTNEANDLLDMAPTSVGSYIDDSSTNQPEEGDLSSMTDEELLQILQRRMASVI